MKVIAAALALALWAVPACAKETYLCMMDITENNDIISGLILIERDVEKDVVMVFDPFIKHYVGDPIPARVTADNASRITFQWELKNVKPEIGRVIPLIQFKLTMQKGSKAATASTLIPLYEFHESGRGTCMFDRS